MATAFHWQQLEDVLESYEMHVTLSYTKQGWSLNVDFLNPPQSCHTGILYMSLVDITSILAWK